MNTKDDISSILHDMILFLTVSRHSQIEEDDLRHCWYFEPFGGTRGWAVSEEKG